MALFNQRVGELRSPTASLEALQEINAICNDIALSQPALEALFDLPHLASQFNQVNSAPSVAMLEFVTQQKYQILGMESFSVSSEGIMSSIGDGIKKAYDWVMKKLGELREWIVSFFRKKAHDWGQKKLTEDILTAIDKNKIAMSTDIGKKKQKYLTLLLDASGIMYLTNAQVSYIDKQLTQISTVAEKELSTMYKNRIHPEGIMRVYNLVISFSELARELTINAKITSVLRHTLGGILAGKFLNNENLFDEFFDLEKSMRDPVHTGMNRVVDFMKNAPKFIDIVKNWKHIDNTEFVRLEKSVKDEVAVVRNDYSAAFNRFHSHWSRYTFTDMH